MAVPFINQPARAVLLERYSQWARADDSLEDILDDFRRDFSEGKHIDGTRIDAFEAAVKRYRNAVGTLNQAQVEVDRILKKQSP